VSDWYAKRCEPVQGIPPRLRRCRQNREAMGNALGHHVAFLLNRERRFPGNHSMNRFSCERIETGGEVLYEIIDQELDMHLWTNEQFLCNEKLNITHWYARNLRKGYIRLQNVLLEREQEWGDNHLQLLDPCDSRPLEGGLEETFHQLFTIPDA
jgi:hypothetical protein